MLFSLGANVVERSYGLYGILACGALAREHNSRCTVVNGVRDVGDLGTGRADVGGHAVEHLGGGDDILAGEHTLADDHLLYLGQLDERYLYAHVAARHHDAVADLDDAVDIVHAALVLDLGDYLYILIAEAVYIVAQLDDVVCRADEGGGDDVDAHPETELDIGAVALADVGHIAGIAGDVDALAVLQNAAGDDARDDTLVIYRLDSRGYLAVVKEDGPADAGVIPAEGIYQLGVREGDAVLVAVTLGRVQAVLLPCLELDGAVLKGADADLGSFCIQQQSYGLAALGDSLLDDAEALGHSVVLAVRHIEARYVHAGVDHPAKDIYVVAGRSHCADNLGHSHDKAPSHVEKSCRNITINTIITGMGD